MTSPPAHGATIEAIVCQADDFSSRLLRWALSDEVCVRLNETTSSMTPIDYARLIIKHHYRSYLKPMLMTAMTPDTRPSGIIPDYLIKSWAFQQVMELVILYRCSTLRPENIGDTYAYATLCLPGILSDIPGATDAEACLGLTHYPDMVSMFEAYHSNSFLSGELGLLHRFTKAIGRITEKTWIFHHRHWRSVFLSDIDKVRAFRAFLNGALVSFMMPDSAIEDTIEMTRQDLLGLMEKLVVLREDTDQRENEILQFWHDLDDYFVETPLYANNNQIMIRCVFEDVITQHRGIFGYACSAPIVEYKIDHPIWDFMDHLGHAYRIDRIISDSISPLDYVIQAFKEHRDSLVTDLYQIVCHDDDASRIVPKDAVWADGMVADLILEAIAFKRFLHLYQGDADQAFEALIDSRHYLLLLQTNVPLGISRIAWMVKNKLEKSQDKFSKKHFAMATNFCEATFLLGPPNTIDIDSNWMRWLQDENFVRDLRSFLFYAYQGLATWGTSLFAEQMHVTRSQFMESLRLFVQYNRMPPSKRAVKALFAVSADTPVAESQAMMVWMKPFEPNVSSE